MFPHSKGPPFKFSLKSLAERYLSKHIQAERHDSIEDAKTAMELARLKLFFGPQFGESETEGVSVCKILTGHRKACTLLDRQDVLRRHAVGSANAILCRSDEEVATKCARECRSESGQQANLVWAQLAELYDHMAAEADRCCDVDAILERHDGRGRNEEREEGEEEAVAEAEADPVSPNSPLAESLEGIQRSLGQSEGRDEALRRMDARIGRIHESLPRNTLMVVLSGQGNTAFVRKLAQLRNQCRRRYQQQHPATRGSGGKDGDKDATMAAAAKGEGGGGEGGEGTGAGASATPPAPLWDERCDQVMERAMKQAAETMCYITVKE